MLIQLTQRQPGGATSPLLLNPDLILRAESAGGGSTVMMSNGTRHDVLEPPDVILDLQFDSRDEGAQRKARDERRKAREEREAAEKKRLAEDARARAADEARRHEEESERHRRSALASAEHAKRLAREAGLPERQVTSNVTPEGVDLKHPAPQPHEGAPAGKPHDFAASQAKADPEKDRQEGAKAEEGRLKAPAEQDATAAHDEAAKKREEPKPLAQQRREQQKK